MRVSGKRFKEFRIGQRFFFLPITVTEAHVIVFAGLSGDFNSNQMDGEFAKKTLFGERIAHGLLTGALMSGPLGMLLTRTAIALLDASFKFTLPVGVGQTISREAEVTELRPSTKHDGGIVKFRTICKNEKSEIVLYGEFIFLVANEAIA